ncbi:YIP1 family protein [Candidatus Woesearchaeota archaeon]|nr:YIP1 family protein [Candidatus Woesearchaeota archaeon]
MAAVKKQVTQTPTSKVQDKSTQPKGYFQTWWNVISDPMNFYEKIPQSMGYKQPTIFALKTQAIVLVTLYFFLLVIGFFFLALLSGTSTNLIGLFGGIGIGIILLIAIAAFPLLIVFTWGMLYVWSAITHLFVLLFGGKQGFKETYIVNCYSMAPSVIALIPLVGYAASAYSLILQGMGVHKRHQLSVGKSVAVVLVPVFIFSTIFLIIYFAFLASALITP